jgi:hypothetical protein
MEWQQIETAPKDGSWYMIICADEGLSSCEVGRYDPMYQDEYKPEGDTGLYRMEKKKFWDYRGFNNHHRATHWMPLPEPPK